MVVLVEVLWGSVVLSSRTSATKRYAGWAELSWVGLSLREGAADLSTHGMGDQSQERGMHTSEYNHDCTALHSRGPIALQGTANASGEYAGVAVGRANG